MSIFFFIFFHSGSKENEGKRTYDGVDVMGERLAKEVSIYLIICIYIYMMFY
jgi:hypothetical protein